MKFSPKIIILGISGSILLVFILIFVGVIPGLRKSEQASIKANLEFWGLYDKDAAYTQAIQSFKNKYPDVFIKYKQFNNLDEYKRALLEAFAINKGPDILMIQNSALPNEINKISPIPATKFSLVNLDNNFPQTVRYDFAPQGNIYALPLSIDTLALIYNRDIIDGAAIQLPSNWEEFQKIIPKLVKFDQNRKISQAAAAIGSSNKNIDNGTDLLYLLMMQTGTKMVSDDLKNATFGSTEGNNAFSFYTKFANGATNTYTWSPTMPNSLDVFANGNAAIIFNYSSSIKDIKAKNSFINIGVTEMPQPKEAKKVVNYAKYFGYAVSNQSKNKDIAWEFIISMTTDMQNAQNYVKTTGKPPALRSLINQYLSDPDLNIFAKQALTSRSWLQINESEIASILSEAIDFVNYNQKEPGIALSDAQSKVTKLMNERAF